MERHVAGGFCCIWYGPRFTLLYKATYYTLLTTQSTAEKNAFPLGKVGMGLFGMAGMGLLDKASHVGLVSDLCAFSVLITAIIVNIVAS